MELLLSASQLLTFDGGEQLHDMENFYTPLGVHPVGDAAQSALGDDSYVPFS